MKPAIITAVLFAVCVAAAWAAVPPSGVVSESVDLIETNHFYDEAGRLVFDQVIFMDWDNDLARFQVRSWRLVKHQSQLPQRDGKGYSTLWADGELLRLVRAPAIRETWTQYDPELVERDILPKERRRELTAQRVPVSPELLRNAKAKWQGVGQ